MIWRRRNDQEARTPRGMFVRILRWAAGTVLATLLCVLAAALYVTFIGVTVDASFLRDTIAGTFSDNLGRTVRFEGAMEMEISATPKLRVGGLHIANAPGFGDGDFASLGEARLALDLWPLLFRKQLHIEELAGSDVQAKLQVSPDGGNNWTFRRPASSAGETSASATKAPVGAGEVLALLDIQRVTLDRLNVEYVGANGKSHFFSLLALSAQSPADAAFKLTLNGTVEKEFPYRLEFNGGQLRDLASDQPWPINFTLTFLSSTLTVDGHIHGNGSGEVRLGLGTENLLEFERLFQTDLPDVGASGLGASVTFSPQRVSITQLVGAMGNTTFYGELEFDASTAKPKLSGSLTAPSLDLRPFRGDQSARTSRESPPGLGDLYRSLAAASLDLRRLNAFDADLTLSVQRWLSLPGNVNGVTLRISLLDGMLRMPLAGSMTGVSMTGEATADANASPPRFGLKLATRDSELGGLAELLFGVRGVEGHLNSLDFTVAAQGARGSELMQSLDVRLNVREGRFSYGNLEGGRPVNFRLDQLAIRLPPGRPLVSSMRGALLGHPFSATLNAGALEPLMLQARTPVEFELRAGHVIARIVGTLEAPASDAGPNIAFVFAAPRAGELASWFGFKSDTQAPVAIAGNASLRQSEWRVNDLLLSVGRTGFVANVSRKEVDGKPLLQLSLSAERLDVAQLESMIPQSDQPRKATARPTLDIPLLPKEIDLSDADVAIRIKDITGTPVTVRNVSFDGHIRDGYMHPSPFSLNTAGAHFRGAVLFDLRGTDPMAGLWLFAEKVDVGQVLRSLGIARELEASVDEFTFNIVTRASRLGDMLARSEVLGAISGGRIVLRDPNTHGEMRISLARGELRADPGKPVRLTLDGALDAVPVSIALHASRLDEFADPAQPLKFLLDADTSNTRITLGGNLARPIGSEVKLALEARGKLFSDLNALTRASLPPWGPWSAQGKFHMSPRGYAVDGLQLRVGASTLNGKGRLETETGRPRLVIALNAPTIQLDDFRFGDWSPVERKPDKEVEVLTPEDIRRKAAAASDQAQQLLSPEMLRRQDVLLDIEVGQVLSGKDKLGAGRMRARLENGRADIGPIQIEIPGGTAALQLGYEPTEQDVKVDFHLHVDKFDYGVLARRIKPDTDLAGTFSVNMDVDSRARYLADILRHGTGHIEFAVWPQNMKSGIFDLWAVNVLVALAPAVDPDRASKVNCAMGRFVLTDGKLTDRTILLDTSRMRVTGTGKADFEQENFALRMRPQPKKAQFFSLATPIEVSGPFEQFKIKVNPGDVIETAARLATSILWVPVQKLFGKKLPSDGSDVCAAPLEATSVQ